MARTAIGELDVHRITELSFPAFPVSEFFPASTTDHIAAAREKLPGRVSDDNRLMMSFHSFVIRAGAMTIMVDTCCAKSRPGRAHFDAVRGDFMGELAHAGVHPEEITHVMCTHLHWDHVGWNTKLENGAWVPTFPNARYIMARKEYEYWDALYAKGGKGDNMHLHSFEDSVLPLMRAERAVLVEDDFELAKGLWLEPCNGHSPGHVVLNAQSGGETGVFVGDVLHHPLQVLFPELSSRADFDMDASRVSRRAFIEKHADTGNLILPQHFVTPCCGRIASDGDGYRFDFVAGT